ncbi:MULTISPECIES: hypothetical protein [Streptomyces]|nr:MULTISPECIES: hypothetical protein [Streptomyces]MCX5079540.1 hypothetical protein [Streptomyces sp. NBC_00401]
MTDALRTNPVATIGKAPASLWWPVSPSGEHHIMLSASESGASSQ